MNKNESKYFNTAILFDEALIYLLENKDIEYITIKEICNKAGVNRSTFYLHYENINDLVEETMNYINKKFMNYFNENTKEFIEKIKNGGFGKSYDAKGGSCVVMNVKTGEVLAMASYPDYNPQSFANGISSEEWKSYNENKSYPLLNKCIQSAYEPGSIFKMVTAMAGLESGNISLTEKINDTGVYKKYGAEWKCWYYTDYHRGHGYLNVIGAIEKSCNFFFYETADRIGIDTLDKYATYFGLGRKTGIELPSETAGTLASKDYVKSIKGSWNPGDTINAAIGQGYNKFTPLQMTKYISMIANGGNNVNVSIVKTIQNADGTEVSKDEINKFVIWIRAIDEGIPIRVENFKTSVLGSIKIQDIRFSIFAERKEDGKIFVISIWNSDISGKYLFMRGNPDDVDKFETTYIYDFLNKEAYLSEDINFLEMEKYYNENEIKENEETLINMQALEAILAYDENKNKKLLEYANFLLDKIINIESMHEIAIINKCQIKKRLGKLTLDDKFELMKIFEKKKDNLIYSISINLLIDKKEDAKKELENLTEYEKEEYLKYPISIFLN